MLFKFLFRGRERISTISRCLLLVCVYVFKEILLDLTSSYIIDGSGGVFRKFEFPSPSLESVALTR